jgi:serine/threonine-protein phosphatase 5
MSATESSDIVNEKLDPIDTLLDNASSLKDKDLEANVSTANNLKDEGNKLLVNFKYALAAEKYTVAIDLHPSAILYSNRAQALIKIESYGLAIQDANEAIRIDPGYLKAYYRRASANYALGKLKEALKDFKAVVKLVPRDADALKKMKQCEKEVRAEAFNRAIESEGGTSGGGSLSQEDIEAISVESTYDGPRLESTVELENSSSKNGFNSGTDPNSSITPEFVTELITYFRDQKLLHRK